MTSEWFLGGISPASDPGDKTGKLSPENISDNSGYKFGLITYDREYFIKLPIVCTLEMKS